MGRLGERSTRIVVKKKRQSGELVFDGPQSGARDGRGGREGQRLWAVDLPELGTTLAELSGGGGGKCVVPNSLENAARFPQPQPGLFFGSRKDARSCVKETCLFLAGKVMEGTEEVREEGLEARSWA